MANDPIGGTISGLERPWDNSGFAPCPTAREEDNPAWNGVCTSGRYDGCSGVALSNYWTPAADFEVARR
jgi:hypothetical protein